MFYCLRSIYQEERAGIQFIGLTLPHFCACFKPGHRFPSTFVVFISVFRGSLLEWQILLHLIPFSHVMTQGWVSDCCFTPREQLFSYIMVRTSSVSMRWWWCFALYWTNMLSWIFIVLAHRTNSPWIEMHYSNSEPTSLCSCFLILHGWRKSNKYKFYSNWFWPDQVLNPHHTALDHGDVYKV